MAKFICLLFLLVTSGSGFAFELKGELTQGSMLRGKVEPDSRVLLDGKPLKLAKNGEFVFGFGRDAKLEHELELVKASGEKQGITLLLSKREYNVQRIEGLPSKMVSPPESVLKRIRADSAKVKQARTRNDDRIDFFQNFTWPAAGPISGVYGSQRVLNGKPKRPHFGVDVAAPVGTPVYAPADGIVTLFEANMYYSGGTMIIDHGHGISSTFLHLHKSHVTAGTTVKQGQLVAEIGDTGRVTGAHLDWRLNWFNTRMDPALLVPKR